MLTRRNLSNTYNVLEEIEEVLLQHMGITEVHIETFNGLLNLTEIDLSHNSIEEIKDNIFKGLSNLITISFNDNRLTNINEQLFVGLNSLKKIYLHNNIFRNNKLSLYLENILEEQNPNLTSVYFEPSHYTCFESVGSLEVYVARSGGDLSKTILVDYKTEDGTAERDTDYIYTEGTLTFYPNETRKHFLVNIIDDDVYEEDEHFNCRISNARYKEQDLVDETTLKCIYPDIATVMILDDDHGGVFIFSEPKMEVIENIGQLRVKVVRTSGARGKVKVPYKTIDGTALGGKDFEKKNDVLTFYNNEIE